MGCPTFPQLDASHAQSQAAKASRRRHKITRKTSAQLKILERAYQQCKGEWTTEVVEQVSAESGL